MNDDATTRRLLTSGVLGAPLFIVVYTLEGATRPAYDPVRQFVSLLSLGDQGWFQVANFLVAGLLFLAFAVGLHRSFAAGPSSRWAPIAVGAVGVGLLTAGIFSTDPGQGYPPGAPTGFADSYSWHANLHFIGAFLVWE